MAGNDLALVRLDAPSRNKLVRVAGTRSTVKDGELLVEVGWGEVADGPIAPRLQQNPDIQVLETEFCNGPSLWNNIIREGMFCGLNFFHGIGPSCEGHHGDPLLRAYAPMADVNLGRPEEDVLIGISSFSKEKAECGQGMMPEVYTFVPKHWEWINGVLEDEVVTVTQGMSTAQAPMGDTSDAFWSAGNVLAMALSASFFIGLAILLGAIVWIGRLRRKNMDPQDPDSSGHPLTSIQADLQFQLLSGGQRSMRLTGERLGEGLLCEIVQGELLGDAPHGKRLVAVKRLKESLTAPNQREIGAATLRRELHVLRLVGEHANIVRFLGHGGDGPGLFIVEEEMPTDLSRFIHSNHRTDGITYAHVVEIFIGVARALQRLHGCGIRHCDLKPKNVLLDERRVPRLADFGVSDPKERSVSEAVLGSELEGGTPAYLAPEWFRGSGRQPVDLNKRDVYSLGVLMWETITFGTPKLYRSAAGLNQASGSNSGAQGSQSGPQGTHSGPQGTHSGPQGSQGGGQDDEVDVETKESFPFREVHPTDLRDLTYDCLNPINMDRPTCREVERRLRDMRQAGWTEWQWR
ncbi:unnamed protein product [Ostreobium quekettii]|uniref:Kinase-like protein n=1 Tax=Ostreobium quekettii TaxID=121088 RepID=A0A8S1J347_9CHLO|nr:unnamed protein product [Ostreobium quekettii]